MKSRTPVVMLALLFVGMVMYSCQKGSTVLNSSSSDSTSTFLGDVTVASSLADSTSGDSTTFHHVCGRGGSVDSIAVESLPEAVTGYLDTAYVGSTIEKAFEVKNADGEVTGYVVILYVDDKPIGVKFDADGNLEGVLEHERHNGRGPRG